MSLLKGVRCGKMKTALSYWYQLEFNLLKSYYAFLKPVCCALLTVNRLESLLVSYGN